jgi:hypothetical protein
MASIRLEAGDNKYRLEAGTTQTESIRLEAGNTKNRLEAGTTQAHARERMPPSSA